jgi:Sec-independent protein translocase protein TatA
MNVLGIGMSELFFIVVVALIILGPKDMQKAGKSIGSFLHKVVTSSEWRLVKDATHQIKTLPNQLMRETDQGLEKLCDDVNRTVTPTSNAAGVGDIHQPIQPSKRS